MQLALAIALTLVYIGVPLTVGGTHPGAGMPWWFFAPAIALLVSSVVATTISSSLPVPWSDGRPYGPPPRPVHLSWRAAIRLPMWAAPLLIPWHFAWFLNVRPWFAVILALAIVPAMTIRSRREIRLLRDGKVAMAFVDSRQAGKEWQDRIKYHFIASDGSPVSGETGDTYGVPKGSEVPVFYDPSNPQSHVVACSCWFEAD